VHAPFEFRSVLPRRFAPPLRTDSRLGTLRTQLRLRVAIGNLAPSGDRRFYGDRGGGLLPPQ